MTDQSSNKMRTAEEPSGTVLHRLIQEQLRYGNPTDARTLLAIQQQALRRGGGGGSGGGGAGSPQSSLESLPQEEPQSPQLSARQEPQGQEHQGDYHSESYQLYKHCGEELPTYEEAKAHSQYLASQWGGPRQDRADGPAHPCADAERWDAKRGHARSLSERLLQLSLERNAAAAAMSSAYSYQQLPDYQGNQHAPHHGQRGDSDYMKDQQGHDMRPEYPFPIQAPGYTLSHAPEYECFYSEPAPPFHPQQNRYVSPVPAPEARYMFPTLPPAGREVSAHNQMEMLMKENERLRQELESHSEKAFRIQKLEQEIQRISEAYETLMQSCAKREALEQTLKSKLMGEIKRLQGLNTDLRDSLENTNIQAAKEVEAADHNQHIMVKLLVQNEEQQLESERLEREVQRLRASAEERRLREEVLEEALGSAQARGQQLQEELHRKRPQVEKVERLQRALAQLQAACEKREGLELRLRTQLEQELRSLRAEQRQTRAPGCALPPCPSSASLQERLREREDLILALEADMTRWEQKYLEESTMRQFAMDAAATAAAQRDTTIIKHSPCPSSNSSFNDDLPAADYRIQEMENRIRALYAQILEKDAVISVLHQRLHQDQARTEAACRRPATSVPSVSTSPPTVTCTDLAKGKSLSDDQTAVSHHSPSPAVPCKARCHDNSTQADGALLGPHATTKEPVAGPKPNLNNKRQPAAVNTFKGLDDLEAEAVEIFI